jgi:hypothetical protein
MSKLAATRRNRQRGSADLEDYKTRVEMIQHTVNKLSFVLKMIDISTLEAHKVCVWCIFYVKSLSKYMSSRHTVQKKHCILATGRDIQYTVNKLSLVLKGD